MFGWFKADKFKELEKKRARMLEEAMHVQRSGDLRAYADKMVAIDALEKEIEHLKREASAQK